MNVLVVKPILPINNYQFRSRSFIKGRLKGRSPFKTYTSPSPLKEEGDAGGEVENNLLHYAFEPGVGGNTGGSASFSDWLAFNLMQVGGKVNWFSSADIAADTKTVNRSPSLSEVINTFRVNATADKNLYFIEAS